MVVLVGVTVAGLCLAATPAGLVYLHLNLAAPHLVLPVGPLGLDQHHLHPLQAGQVGDAAVGVGVAGATTAGHHDVVRYNLAQNYYILATYSPSGIRTIIS